MSVSSLIRRQMHRFAKEQGFVGDLDATVVANERAPLASGLPPRPKEFVNARWYAHSAYETERLYDRLTAEGHTEQDVADWYQQPVEALRARVDSVRNPALTEEEKIARQRALLTMRANALGLPPPGQAAPHVLDPAVAAKLDDLFP